MAGPAPVLRVRFYRTAEVRTRLANRIARVLFTTFEGEAVLLHGFIKKSGKTPLAELRLARRRKRTLI